jgi:hypothetical protein
MAIAAKKLKHQQSKPTSSNINPISLSKETLKNLPKIPKNSNIKKVQSTSKIPPSQKKIKKLKRLDNQSTTISPKIIQSFSKIIF